MSAFNEINAAFKPYIGCDLLASNKPINPGDIHGSDNGPMFTAEEFVIALKRGGDKDSLSEVFACLIHACLYKGLLNRVPRPDSASQTGPDDYYGVLNACLALGITDIPRGFLWASVRFLGALNNNEPGKWTAQSFLVRQGQLVAAMITAAFPSYINPLHWIIRILAFPLYLWAAIVIAISCVNTPVDQTDPRRLSWHLAQATQKHSLLCYLASKLWYKRLYRDYGPTGMQAVAAIYYIPRNDNPYAKYWVTE